MCCAEDKLTFSEIRERANLPEEDLVRILHSLSCSKYKILSKDPPTKTPGKTDTFSMNANFTDRMRRIRVRSLHLPSAVTHPSALQHLWLGLAPLLVTSHCPPQLLVVWLR